ncbi:hypothetical protein SAMN05660909_02520 [Chitinophaga terrae (ex Kim and Jung 2007)]|uniref:Uncharacterized protein n=1 Tax=Chitinophaga terrae (ex Kim and Jung 2007) TaxID=408074 RepID=A0A1H4CC44_9BACT|nr:hypothetical protein [Chitinophaga terrae (ex Kim and Jung 2007)]MDQ0110078.1 membrane protein implicated in regulation of membrane protease activity [Chitinophaga terrae (ex Kim and Jung 2007)]GEP88866.1 hypothetical protein CTE07_05110 [Chitinophaga terrae (ex Kim and Jung 2007)]SEA57662.1 hypothetical protein SAMN05660909_02520 [Chitinophaga terrae (ex Kim and Jung 2007)]
MKTKTFAHFLLILILAYVAGMVMPWWSTALVAFLVTILIPLTPGKAFSSAFIAIFLLWLALAFYMDVRNDHILANRMSEMILKVRSAPLIGVVSSLIGGLVAGFASLTAAYLRAPRKVA